MTLYFKAQSIFTHVNSRFRMKKILSSLLLVIAGTVASAQEPYQQIWQMPGSFSFSSFIGPGQFDGDFNFGNQFDFDIDGLPDIVTVGQGGTSVGIQFSSTSQGVTLTPLSILNDTIYLLNDTIALVGGLPGTGSTSGLRDMIWVQREGNNIIAILIGIIELSTGTLNLYNPLTDDGFTLSYDIIGLRDFNNDGLLEILILDENMDLRMFGPPDD